MTAKSYFTPLGCGIRIPLLWGVFVLLFTLIPVSHVAAQTLTCVAPPADLVSWWPGDVDASDIAGTNDGAFTSGATITTTADGRVGKAFFFDGFNDYIQLPFDSGIFTNQLTLEAWVYPTKIPSGGLNQGIINNDFNGNRGLHMSFGDSAGDLSCTLHDSANTAQSFVKKTIPRDTWTHAACTYDGTTLAVYANGTGTTGPNSTNASGTVRDNGVNFRIGQDQFNGVHFGGRIDELAIYDRAPTSTEIQAIVTAGSAGKCKVTTVEVDIKPGSDPNSINLCSNGAVPVAIFGSATLDVWDVDTDNLRFAEAAVKVVGKKDPNQLCSYQDINGDFISDLVCHFVTTDIAGIDGESTTATVNGELFDGTPIEGTDSVNIVKDTCN